MSGTAPPPIVRSFHHADTGTWSHVVVDPVTRNAAVIDAVLDFDLASGRIWSDSARRILEYVEAVGLRVAWVLETHAHADHLSAGTWLRERTGAPLCAGTGIVEVQRTFKRMLDLGDEFAADGSEFDRLFADGETFRTGELEMRAIATPGHTPDSVSYLAGDAVFVGDTLFAPHAGTARCDFPGSDAAMLYRSIRRLYALPETTRVFLCHDYPAKDTAPVGEVALTEEKAGNIHVRSGTDEATFVALRTQRDATLPAPKLLWPAIQFNLRGGRLAPGPGGKSFFKLPVAFAAER